MPAPGAAGFRLTISRAGDWTGALIDDLPERLWVKGITTAGVANIETLFTKVVYVATGSGIGPCLPHLLARAVPARLVWATRSPRITYGDALVEEIMAVQPDAVVWDTAEHGKPDMVSPGPRRLPGLRRRGGDLHLQQEAHLAGRPPDGAQRVSRVRRHLGFVKARKAVAKGGDTP